MKIKITELFLEKSDRMSGYTQLVAKTEDGDEYIICGDYCGGVPFSSWRKIKQASPTQQGKKI